LAPPDRSSKTSPLFCPINFTVTRPYGSCES
jgi:hypothetical protein